MYDVLCLYLWLYYSFFIYFISYLILTKYFPYSQEHVLGFQIYYFSHVWCFWHSHRHLSLFSYWFELYFLSSNLYLHLHDIRFVNVFDSFIPVIMLNTLIFKSSVFFGTHTLLDKSLRVLKLPTHLSNLTVNG